MISKATQQMHTQVVLNALAVGIEPTPTQSLLPALPLREVTGINIRVQLHIPLQVEHENLKTIT